MFDMGFLPDIRRILKGLNPPEKRRTFLFSATLNSQVGYLAWEFMHDPGEVLIEPEKVSVQTINQELYHVAHDEKVPLLLGILKKYQPRNAVFFVNTKQGAVRLARKLAANGYPADYLIGDMPQSQRLKVIQRFKEGKLAWMVATDVAARGLHIEDLDLVVNFDLPLEAETYVHRIGRTARAGKSGRAVSLACEKFVYGLKAIEDLLGFKIPVQWLDESELVEDQDKRHDSEDVEDRGARRGGERRRTGDRARSTESQRRRKVSQLVSQAAGSRHATDRAQEPATERRKPSPKKGHMPAKAETPPPGAMATLEDKLAYYKKKYGAEFQKAKEVAPPATPAKTADPRPKTTSAETTEKPSRSRRRRRSARKRAAASDTALQKVSTDGTIKKGDRPPMLEESPPRKEGFWKRLFGFFKGKKE